MVAVIAVALGDTSNLLAAPSTSSKGAGDIPYSVEHDSAPDLEPSSPKGKKPYGSFADPLAYGRLVDLSGKVGLDSVLPLIA